MNDPTIEDAARLSQNHNGFWGAAASCLKTYEDGFSIFGENQKLRVGCGYGILLFVAGGLTGHFDHTTPVVGDYGIYTLLTFGFLAALPPAADLAKKAYNQCVATEEHQALLPHP